MYWFVFIEIRWIRFIHLQMIAFLIILFSSAESFSLRPQLESRLMNTIQEATSAKAIASFDAVIDRFQEPSTRVPLIDSLEGNNCKNTTSCHDEDCKQLKQSEVDGLVSLLQKHRETLVESLATTVEEDAAYDNSLRRYHEQYEDAVREQEELRERLSIQRARHNRVSTTLEGNLLALRDKYDTAVRHHAEREKAKDQSQHEEIRSIRSEHRQQIDTLSTQKAALEIQLSQIKLKHKGEEDGLVAKRQELQDAIDSRSSSHAGKMKKIQSQADDCKRRIYAEAKERERLQTAEFDLIENERIRLEEEATLRRVIELEQEADRILNHGATQLQKLYRGMRDRAVFAQLKSKKSKGREGTKGGAKKKKKGGKK